MVVTPHVDVTEGLHNKAKPELVTPTALNPVGAAGGLSVHTEDVEDFEDADVTTDEEVAGSDDADDFEVLTEDDLDVLTEEGTDDLLEDDEVLTSFDELEPPLIVPQTSNSNNE